MAHSVRYASVKRIASRYKQLRWLSSHVDGSSLKTCNLCTQTSKLETQISLLNEFSKKFNLDAIVSKFYKKSRTAPRAVAIGLPVEEHVYAGHAYLHWGNVDTYRTQDDKNQSPLNNDSYSTVSSNIAACAVAKTLEKDEVSDWLTDVDQCPFINCSSFYSNATTTHNVGVEDLRFLMDDTHFDATNISPRNEDDIILRDIENYKVRVDENLLDSSGDDENSNTSSVLKSSLTQVYPQDLDSILKSDLYNEQNVRDRNINETGELSHVYIDNPNETNILQFSLSDIKNTLENNDTDHTRPTREQITEVKEFLLDELPKFFHRKKKLHLYHKEIIFEDNFSVLPKVTHGIGRYLAAMVKARVLANLKYASLSVNLLSVTTHEDEGLIKVRWQVLALSQFKAFMFWKFLPHNYSENRGKHAIRYDGFSIFTVGHDGLIHKHRLDRVITDQHYVTSKAPVKLSPAVAV